MEMPRFTNSFKGGMNKDISPNEYPNTCYLDAVNYRIIVDESSGLSTAALATPKGNLASFTLPALTYYLGHTTLREKLVILAKHTDGIDTRPDKVYVLSLSSVIAGTNIVVGGAHLVYEQNLNFDITKPIRIVGNYENSDIQKIYWVDGVNPLRHLNIVSNPDYNDLSTLDPELLNIIPNHTYGSFELSEITGGHLKAGRIQYAYQLYSISGTETMFSPPSPLYNLSASGMSDGIDFVGSEIETEINKSIRITITLDALVTSTFNRIRLVALEYETYGDTPTVRVVVELELGTSVVSFVDSGNTIGELVLEEFQTIRNEITPTTIETKNNYLFAANITQDSFDIDELVDDIVPGAFLDTRVYRWRYVEPGGGALAYGSQVMNESTDPAAIGDAGGTGYGLDCFDFTDVQLFETAWELNIGIGAVAHAAAQIPARTVTGISALNGLGSTLHLRHIEDNSWTTGGGLTISMTGATIQSWDSGTGILKIRGSQWYYSPDDLAGTPYFHSYPTDFNGKALTEFSYTYTYSYVLPGGASVYECTINKKNGLGDLPGISNTIVIDDGIGGGQGWDAVPEKDDAINTFNDIGNDTIVVDHHQFKFKHAAADPPTYADLGGTGKYISFEFITEQLDDIGTQRSIAGAPSSNFLVDPYALSDSYANPSVVMDFTSYQRDEVYRFGIVFYDLKGRPSFAKWIADIRFPDVNEFLYTDHTNSSDYYEISPVDTSPTTVMNGLALGIKFSINWNDIETNFPGLLAQLSGFQIVRAPRTELDCTIKAQGIIVPTHNVDVVAGSIKDSNYSSFNVTGAFDYDAGGTVTSLGATISGTNADVDKTLVELISPEIVINKNLTIDTSDDFLEVIGHLDNVTAGAIVVATDQVSYTVTGMTIDSLADSPTYLATRRRTITGGFISYPEAKSPTSRIIDGTSYTPRGYNDDVNAAPPIITYKGTSLVVKITSAFGNIVGTSIAADEKAMYGRYRRNLGHSAYGGATYTERSYTTYISANIYDDSVLGIYGGISKAFQTIATPYANTPYEVWGGDTYICPFNYLKLFYDYNGEYSVTPGEHGGQVLVAFPTESRINLNYKLDNIPKYFTVPIVTPLYYLAEKYTIGIAQYPNNYPDGYDLYRYNSAYSAENIAKTFIPKPFDFRETKVNDVMVVSSEKKYNGEYSDSWLKFKFNNYIELEGEYGAITRLINNNERLVAFQPRAIAVLSVLERELVETNNIATLAVGTGGILSRYDYITRLAGASWYDAITPTESGIYFYDDKNITLYRIIEGLEPISDTKGMKSYFDTTSTTSLISAYDRDNREVLFSPYQTNTICFSGFIDAFSGFYTFNSGATYVKNYITFDKYLLSSLDGRVFYLHNVGNYNQYYGNYQTSTLTLITNPIKNNVVTFHTIDWLTDLTTAGVETPADLILTFDTLRITNTHQDTGTLTLSTWLTNEDLKRRFRKWRINTFRDTDNGRIRDSWIKSHFVWTQPSNKKLVVHPIDYLFLPTKIR